MTNIATILIIGSLVASIAAAPEKEQAKIPKCPEWADGIPVPIEHGSEVCDWSSQNSPQFYQTNGAALHQSLNSGALFKMKDEKTWICPEDEGVSSEQSGHNQGGVSLLEELQGPKTKWIVRNKSSNPVSIALVDASRNNLEVSALNPKVNPAHADPEAVLPPGKWKALDVTLGTILHVRELLRVGDDVSPGRVLVRHRPGPVAVRDQTVVPKIDSKAKSPIRPKPKPAGANRKLNPLNPKAKTASAAALNNSTTAQSKQKMNTDAQKPKIKLPIVKPTVENKAEKEAQRGRFDFDRLCNSISLLFVNRVGKPVDVYWAGASELDSSAGAAERANECDARFAFHLGMLTTPSKDFFEKWDSYMSLENTYLGHRFVARLASNSSKVLHEIVMDRTDVGDCTSERKVKAAAAAREGVGIEVGGRVNDGEDVQVHKIVIDGYDAAATNLTSVNMGVVGTAAA